jgi:hypothetical protein
MDLVFREGQRRNDVLWSAEGTQRQLDGGAGGLLGLQKNKPILVRDNHAHSLLAGVTSSLLTENL